MAPPDRSLVRLLAEWLPRQRWFGGKHRPIDGLSIGTATVLRPGDPALHHLVLDVGQDGVTDRYQVLLGVRRDLPERLRPGEIGRVRAAGGDAEHIYDAACDPELTGPLLAHMAAQDDVGPVRFRHSPGAAIRTGLAAAPSPAEQSNTSLIFGDAYICKLFRRLAPGVNPDLEINLALSRQGCGHVPAVHGWMELEPGPGDGGEPATLALLSEYLRTGTDGWQLALTSVRDWFAQPGAPAPTGAAAEAGAGPGAEPVLTARDAGAAGGDFAAEAERLGAATAQVHRDLAAAFGVTEVPADELRSRVADMNDHLSQVSAAVPDLRPYTAAIRDVFARCAANARPLPFQRVHGDYHLGQAMRTGTGWVLLDFEGEPARTPRERRALGHPLRDVAGMLRSFEYAARYLQSAEGGDAPPAAAEAVEQRARAWSERNRAAFCRGYAAAGGPDPVAHAGLLRALELDKAVYEVRYEARNRPSWLPVPLRTLDRLAG